MRGRSFYTWGAVLFVLTGAIHGIGHFQAPSAEPAHVAAQEAMGKATDSMMGMTLTLDDAWHCLSWYMTVFSILTGLFALSLCGRLRTDVWLLRRTSLLLAIGAGVLSFFGFRYHVAPPGLLYGIAALLLLIAAVRAKAAS